MYAKNTETHSRFFLLSLLAALSASLALANMTRAKKQSGEAEIQM
jgi:hypothetical protein